MLERTLFWQYMDGMLALGRAKPTHDCLAHDHIYSLCPYVESIATLHAAAGAFLTAHE